MHQRLVGVYGCRLRRPIGVRNPQLTGGRESTPASVNTLSERDPVKTVRSGWRKLSLLAALALALAATTSPVAASPAVTHPSPPNIHQPVINKHQVPGAITPGAIALYTSGNWAGYVATTGNTTTSFNTITSNFTVPSVNCSPSGSGYSFAYHWVGLDGWTDGTVEQTGVADFCEAGTPTYASWWETYPGGINVTYGNVSGGDQMAATVNWTGSTYAMIETDVTTGSVVINVNVPCQSGSLCNRSSAEVITEGYPSGGWLGTADYARSLYDAVRVTNQAGHSGAVNNSAWHDGEVQAVNGLDLISKPGVLYSGSGRNAFEIDWHAVS